MAQLKNAMRIGANDSGKIAIGSASAANMLAMNGGGADTVITAAQNTNGVIVRTLVVAGKDGSNSQIIVYADNVPILGARVESNMEAWSADREIILKAGVELSIAISNNNSGARATWDDLP